MATQLYIDPFHADASSIEKGSHLDMYFAGEVGADLVNWAWLCGDDPFRQGGMKEAAISTGAFADIYEPAKGRAGRNARRLTSALKAGPEAVMNFVREKRNLHGLWAVDTKCKKQLKGVRRRAVLAMVMADLRAKNIPCPNEA